jgi:hypothetical protein
MKAIIWGFVSFVGMTAFGDAAFAQTATSVTQSAPSATVSLPPGVSGLAQVCLTQKEIEALVDAEVTRAEALKLVSDKLEGSKSVYEKVHQAFAAPKPDVRKGLGVVMGLPESPNGVTKTTPATGAKK